MKKTIDCTILRDSFGQINSKLPLLELTIALSYSFNTTNERDPYQIFLNQLGKRVTREQKKLYTYEEVRRSMGNEHFSYVFFDIREKLDKLILDNINPEFDEVYASKLISNDDKLLIEFTIC